MAHEGNLADLATITSRNEALVIASALEHAGVRTWIDGVHHASVDPISIALGGHRLRVFADQWEEASAIVHEMGLPDGEIVFEGQKLAVQKLLFAFVGLHVFLVIPNIIAGLLPLTSLWLLPSAALGVPVDPRGQNDWYLAQDD
ncbi:hypothetical protein [Aurantiacibacter gilvus]|uniref:DUF2007 domain-containing protein n=1 Tax=Aurantiacibacter gilvus TaxID=3139141 RepID=A0ABU9IH97_9SPHN